MKKGSLGKLWFAVLAVILAGAALAWASVPVGVSVTTISAGIGPSPERGDIAFVNYTGTLDDGTVFTESPPGYFPIPNIMPDGVPIMLESGASIDGFVDGLVQMQKGGNYSLFIPAVKAYGDFPPQGSDIPPGANLTFEIELVDFLSPDEFDERQAVMQQMMMMQQQMLESQAGEDGLAPAQ